MKQSVPQASALNEYSIDVRISVFSAASKITLFELFAGFALILVNSGERKNDLRPLISTLKAIKSFQLYILYFNTSVSLNMHMQMREFAIATARDFPLYIGKWLIFLSSYLVKCLFYLGP